MIKRILVVALTGVMLAGCADPTTSGDVYSASQAKRVQTVTFGTVVSVRPVQIQGSESANTIGAIGGAVLGGLIGNTIGGGSGRNIATAAGAVAGGVVGNSVGSVAGRSSGVELEIKTDNKENIVVVQRASATQFNPGQRVRMAQNGDTVTVSPL
ncbi:glycine zipper 2TM domain-containing protein [Serratia sp. DD3]|uniref:glycine zipper 2TM domain-containing protein n=1 Tax=Serratia sp. DD3 TaxID=1410619 RepID=UPI0003C516D7|nr:glycine zipper 2TM domain-containing protein [Serratia sp. DD3]KEY58012.1 outer membrane lipoprotein SlyB [Serratia sp. DD3]